MSVFIMSIVFGDGGYLTIPDQRCRGLRKDICNPWIKKPPHSHTPHSHLSLVIAMNFWISRHLSLVIAMYFWIYRHLSFVIAMDWWISRHLSLVIAMNFWISLTSLAPSITSNVLYCMLRRAKSRGSGTKRRESTQFSQEWVCRKVVVKHAITKMGQREASQLCRFWGQFTSKCQVALFNGNRWWNTFILEYWALVFGCPCLLLGVQ